MTECVFADSDFACFAPEKQRSRAYNSQRLVVRRKLESLGKFLLPDLQKAGLRLVKQTSLHHPYTYNLFRVDSLWVYFSRQKSELADLQTILGESFTEELDSHYTHAILLVGIDGQQVYVSLKIPQRAWWDGQNLKYKCAQAGFRQEFRVLLNRLNGFTLAMHDWKKLYPGEQITADDVETYLHYYTPGNHWLHLDRKVPRTDPLACSAHFAAWASENLQALAPIYQFITWSAQNNFLFRQKEG